MDNKKLDLLTAEELAEELKISTRTLSRLRTGADFPEPFALSQRALRWQREDIRKWLETRRMVTQYAA